MFGIDSTDFKLVIHSPTSNIRILEPHGPIDFISYEIMEKAFINLQNEYIYKIIVDLSLVPRISSVGIGVLISCQTDLSERPDGKLVLIAPREEVLNTFEVMQYDTVFTILDDAESAIRLLKGE